VLGSTPLSAVRVVSGPAELEVTKEGYLPVRRRLVLEGGKSQTVDLALLSSDTNGMLSVRADVANAEVFVDGARIGVTPLETQVPAGTHTITLEHPDRDDYETSAAVPAGGVRTLDVTMDSPSVTSRWWFWTGVGAVVVTGAIITIALLTERSPDTGTIEPGTLQAPGSLGLRF
jgi:hypothetical protein